jgi:L-rhamnose mutarotase
MNIKRVGSLINLPKENYGEYKKAHDEIWHEIIELMKDCNIQNYSIYYKDEMLFSYYEYTGSDYEKDMRKMADSPICKKWWDWMMPMQRPVATRKDGEWWAEMEEAFHMD